MGLKERVMGLFLSDDHDGLRRLAVSEPRAVRHLLGRLWDPSARRRQAAGAALGAAAAARPEQGRDLLRRVTWALRDEAASHAAHAAAAVAEIAIVAPAVARPFIGPLVTTLEDPGVRSDTLAALVRLAGTEPGLVRPHADRIRHLAGRSADPALMAQLEELLQEGDRGHD